MKYKPCTIVQLIALILCAAISPFARAQGTAFTYQGLLTTNGSPANGNYDLLFILYNSNIGGAQAGPILTNSPTAVSNGLFTTTIDFGSGVLTGTNYWLDIWARPTGGGGFVELSPRQSVTPAPYAVFANAASNVLGIVPASQINGPLPSGNFSGTYGNAVTLNNANNSLSGSFSGNGAGVTNVNAATLNGMTSAAFWQLGGNTVAAGQFLGSTNNQAIEIRANGVRTMRFEPVTGNPNVIGGWSNNLAYSGVSQATIGGGGGQSATTPGLFLTNVVSDDYGTVAGGLGNLAGNTNGSLTDARGATVGGGVQNTASGLDSVVAGGNANIANGTYSTVLGGAINNAGGTAATVGGGEGNVAHGFGSVVAGGGSDGSEGTGNLAFGVASVIGGGVSNTNAVDAQYSTIAGGNQNGIGGQGEFGTIGGGGNNYLNGPLATIAGGTGNYAGGTYSTVGGGSGNQATGEGSFIGGGGAMAFTSGPNMASGPASVVVGGLSNSATAYGSFVGGGGVDGTVNGSGNFVVGPNTASGNASVIVGGMFNTNTGNYAVIPGGYLNIAAAPYTFAAGYNAQANHAGAFVWSDDSSGNSFASTAANSFNVRSAGGARFVTSGAGLTVDGSSVLVGPTSSDGSGLTNLNASNLAHGTIPNGVLSGFQSADNYNTIGGGQGNAQGAGTWTTIAGGDANLIAGSATTIAGGQNNTINGTNAVIGNNLQGTVGGGYGNAVSASYGTVAGGENNTENAYWGAIAGGQNNKILSTASAAAIGGGTGNTNSGNSATIPGGYQNVASGAYSFAAGNSAVAANQGAFVWADSQGTPFSSTGNNQFLIRAQGGVGINTNNPNGAALSVNGTIVATNFQDPSGSFVAGVANSVSGANETVGGGNVNSATGGYATVGGGENNHVNGEFGTVGGGGVNYATGTAATVAGGTAASAVANYATVSGGYGNQASGQGAFVGGGGNDGTAFFVGNLASGNASTIAGGAANTNSALYGFLGGGIANNIGTGANGAIIVGGQTNTILSLATNSLIAGGAFNNIPSGTIYSTIGGGLANTNSGSGFGTIAGGVRNVIQTGAYDSVISGGAGNQVQTTAGYGSIAGGQDNWIQTLAGDCTIGGGQFNVTLPSSTSSVIAGGSQNTNSGVCATVAGGLLNRAVANFTFAAGRQANALHQGAFVWADSQGGVFPSTTNDQFLIRAQGGVGIDTSTTLEDNFCINTNTYLYSHPIYLRGETGSDHNHGLAYCGNGVMNFGTVQPDGPALWGYAGGVLGVMLGGAHAVLTWTNGGVLVTGGFSFSSDRNLKADFAPLDAPQILDRVAALPVSSWVYKTDTGARHIGPMAQDFHAAFAVNGADDTHINVGDEAGVALAAIQGLNQKLESDGKAKDAEIEKLKHENQELSSRLDDLAATVKMLAERK